MSKSTLRILAVLLTTAIVVILFAGLDSLSGEVRKQIGAERTAYAAAQKQLDASKTEVDRDRSQEPALFGAIPSARGYADRLSRGQSMLAAAGHDIDDLTAIEKRNRRSDRTQAESLLKHERRVRESAVAEAEAVRKDAAQWIDRKQHLPQEVQDMERDYKAVQAVDLNGLAGVVQKAEGDWPEKKNDLDSRLASVRATAARADQAWQGSEEARRALAVSGDGAGSRHGDRAQAGREVRHRIGASGAAGRVRVHGASGTEQSLRVLG